MTERVNSSTEAASRHSRIETALDTLTEMCTRPSDNDADYGRRAAAEEILRHYREDDLRAKGITVNVHLDNPVPVRPMTRVEMSAEQ